MNSFDDLDLPALSPAHRYKLLSALVVPRPIALVTSLNTDGVVNGAPFSFFNVVGEDPPTVMLSIGKEEGGRLKDTTTNILNLKEFVVHIADQSMLQALHDCGHPFAPEVSEIAATGLTVHPSLKIRVPSIVEAPVALECRLLEAVESSSRHVIFGEVVWVRLRKGLLNAEGMRINLEKHSPPARMGGGLYIRTDEVVTVKSSYS